jgi:phage shock protein A
MPGVMKRLSAIMQSKANKVLDKAENPADMLDMSYQDQLQNLQKVRRALADVATSRKRLELQAGQLQQQADKLQQQAKQALSQNREDLAREALSRRTALADQLQQLATQHEQVEQQQQQLEATAQKLQVQVDAFRTRKETLKATYTASKAQASIGESMSGISESMTDAGMTLQRAQDKISDMQARAGAIDELLDTGALPDITGSGDDDLTRELNATASAGQVDNELAALKAELSAGQPAASLPAGSAAASDASTATPPAAAPPAAPEPGQPADSGASKPGNQSAAQGPTSAEEGQ